MNALPRLTHEQAAVLEWLAVGHDIAPHAAFTVAQISLGLGEAGNWSTEKVETLVRLDLVFRTLAAPPRYRITEAGRRASQLLIEQRRGDAAC